jgi:D-alanyl-D-alanine carboxypeptidase
MVARFDEPIPAPIAAGAQIGEVIAYLDDNVVGRAPLVAKNRVKKIHFLARIWKNLGVIFGT